MQLAIRLKLHRWSPSIFHVQPYPLKDTSLFLLTSQYQKEEFLQAIPSHPRSAVSPAPDGLGHPVVFPTGNIRLVVGDSTCVLNTFQVPTAPTPTPPPLDLTNALLTTKYRQSRGEGHFHQGKTVVTPCLLSLLVYSIKIRLFNLQSPSCLSGSGTQESPWIRSRTGLFLVYNSPGVQSDSPFPREGC